MDGHIKGWGRWFLVLALAGASVFAQRPAEGDWREVSAEQMDSRLILDRGRDALGMGGMNWRHAETEHFVVHFEQEIFARKVARMAEFFYTYIAGDLEGAKDRLEGRSHIFIFRAEKDWKTFRAASGGVNEWAFSFVSGPAMFLQQAKDISSSGKVLAHEMTHLVMNRFLAGRLPIWLNEGIAEYYEEFAYPAFKGIKKSRRAQFSRMKTISQLQELFEATAYPQDTASVLAFYKTAKYVVGWLRLDYPADRFVPFVETVSKSGYLAAFQEHYGLNSLEDVRVSFLKFAR